VIDEYQIIEARSIGADAVLLIAECLEEKELAFLASFAQSLGLEVLMEVHSQEQLGKITENVDLLGVNNRDLTTFEVSLATSMELAKAIPEGLVKVSESGISDPQAIVQLKDYGFEGFLIGEHFMREPDPGKACGHFIQKLIHLEDMYKNAIA
jgi:indole-3-glycerol phosphate synthase